MNRPYLRDQEANDRDELAARRRQRDRHREPATGMIKPAARVTQGARFMVGADPSTIRFECPSCLGPVYGCSDVDGEDLDCATCDARLRTHRDDTGEMTVIQRDLQPGGDA